MNNLWGFHDLLKCIEGRSLKDFPEGFVTGISIDSRSIALGEAFFAIRGRRYDGHDYIIDVAKKASLVVINADMVSLIGSLSIPVFIVEDVLSALHKLAIKARLRSKAKIIAITGSVGKTTTKEMLKYALSSAGKTHVCVKSYNNHIGVPLTLARMPEDAEFAVFELGMNKPGEIRFLTQLVRPHIAMITTVSPAHLGNFSGMDEIAAAKAEIIEGLEQAGSVILNRDNQYFDFIQEKCQKNGISAVFSFGESKHADFRMIAFNQFSEQSRMTFNLQGKPVEVVSNAIGHHMAYNLLATLSVIFLLKVDIYQAIHALSLFHPAEGRGKRYRLALDKGFFTLVDESYNANPASMQAAISILCHISPYGKGRRIAILGDMGEMGEMAESFHADLATILSLHNILHVWMTGKHMMALKKSLPINIDAQYYEKIEDLIIFIKKSIIEGDVIVIKSSRMYGFDQIVRLLLEKYQLIK